MIQPPPNHSVPARTAVSARWWIALVLLGLVLGLLACIVLPPGEPHYQGLSLHDWTLSGEIAYSEFIRKPGIDRDRYAEDPKWREACDAMKKMNPAATALLLDWAKRSDSPAKARFMNWLDTHPSLHLHLKSSFELHHSALVGFALLGTNANAAWPELMRLTSAPDPEIRSQAFGCLISSKADKKTLHDISVRLAKDPVKRVQIWAENELRRLDTSANAD